jgi:ABC-type Fe3+ transport system permease subunit
VPGSVIAVGVLIPVTRLDHWLAGLWQQMTGANPGLILTGGIAALVYAYLARFLAIALQTVEAGLAASRRAWKPPRAASAAARRKPCAACICRCCAAAC